MRDTFVFKFHIISNFKPILVAVLIYENDQTDSPTKSTTCYQNINTTLKLLLYPSMIFFYDDN